MSREASDGGMLMVFCTFPDRRKAREIGGLLVGEKLAACVNLLPDIESIYVWDGELRNEPEVLAVFKLAECCFDRFEGKLKELHPYDVPEIVALDPRRVSGEYLDWVGRSCRQ